MQSVCCQYEVAYAFWKAETSIIIPALLFLATLGVPFTGCLLFPEGVEAATLNLIMSW